MEDSKTARPHKRAQLTDLIPFKQLLEMRDTRREYDDETGERRSLFFSSGIVWRKDWKTGVVEVVIVDYFDSRYTQEIQVKFPGSETQFEESPREAFNRAIVAQTGFIPRNNEYLMHAYQSMRPTKKGFELAHAKTVFVMRVPYRAGQQLQPQVPIIEGADYRNPRWHPIGDELLLKLFHTHHAAYKKFIKVVIDKLGEK